VLLVVTPVQTPFVAVRRWPTCAEPEIAGRLTLAGALAFARTMTVEFEKADVLPAALVATTVARICMPTWASPSSRLEPVLPARFVQVPAVVQLCH
jgi:hypothetical protein